MTNTLQAEIDYRISTGFKQVSVYEFEQRFRDIGYMLDRSHDCRSTAQWMTGPEAGRTYPCCTVYPVEIDTGKSFAHFEARRDANFDALQKISSRIFAVSKGAILEN